MNTFKCFYIFTFLLSVAVIQSKGQTFTKSEEPYKSKLGKIYKVGDSIIVASPADFSNQFLHFYQGKTLQTKVVAKGVSVLNGTEYPYDYRYTRRVIKHFKIYPDHGTFAVFDNLFNLMINIDKGVEFGEILSEKGWSASYNKSKYLNDSTAYQEFVSRENSITINNVKEYLYLFENSTYNGVREDEFEFQKQIKKTEKKLLAIKSKIDTSQIFKMSFIDELGNFDFEKSSFPIVWENNGISLLSDNWEFFTPADINKNKVELTDLRINFTNVKKFPLLPIIEDKANHFVKRRKNDNGDVDRKIYMQIHYKIKELKNGKDNGFDKAYITGEKYLMCEIIKIDFFEDEYPSYNFINSIGTLNK